VEDSSEELGPASFAQAGEKVAREERRSEGRGNERGKKKKGIKKVAETEINDLETTTPKRERERI